MNSQKQNIAVSIVIVNYKTPLLLSECIESIIEDTKKLLYEIIVVDNHSEDDSKRLIEEKFPNVRWFDAGYNSGFARGNNLGIQHAAGENVLLLNSDTVVKNDLVAGLYNTYKNYDKDGKLGLLGCRIISSVDGSLLIGSVRGHWGFKQIIELNPISILLRRWLGKPYTKPYNAYDMHYKNHEVDVVSGACVMLGMDKIKRHKLLLDEDFFLYFEDVEWSLRSKRLGYKNWFCADLEVYHVNAGSNKSNFFREAQIQISSFLFLRKIYSPLVFWACGFLYFINFIMTDFLLKRKNINDSWKENKAAFAIWKKYFPYVFSHYKKRTSSNPNYLKYVE